MKRMTENGVEWLYRPRFLYVATHNGIAQKVERCPAGAKTGRGWRLFASAGHSIGRSFNRQFWPTPEAARAEGKRLAEGGTPYAQNLQYEAEWIEKQHRDKDGEWDPDRDEYTASYHATREDAQNEAVRASKAVGECEWWSVSEQRYISGQWVTIQRWTGDWTGFCERSYTNDVDKLEVG